MTTTPSKNIEITMTITPNKNVKVTTNQAKEKPSE